jgi:hypothetical protein
MSASLFSFESNSLHTVKRDPERVPGAASKSPEVKTTAALVAPG